MTYLPSPSKNAKKVSFSRETAGFSVQWQIFYWQTVWQPNFCLAVTLPPANAMQWLALLVLNVFHAKPLELLVASLNLKCQVSLTYAMF
jgi:hypothetical protein